MVLFDWLQSLRRRPVLSRKRRSLSTQNPSTALMSQASEALEQRVVLTLNYNLEWMTVEFVQDTVGTFRATDDFANPDDVDYWARYNGTIENENVSIVYTSPSQGTATAGARGTILYGMENIRQTGPLGNWRFTGSYEGSVTLTVNGNSLENANGYISQNVSPGNSNQASGAMISGTGTFSPGSFDVNWSYSTTYGGSGRYTMSMEGSLTPFSEEDYDLILSEVYFGADAGYAQEGASLTYRLDVQGAARTPTDWDTPVAQLGLYWATGPNPGDIMGGAFESQPIYWNTAGASGSINELPTPPNGATHLIVMADQANALQEVDDLTNNFQSFGLYDIEVTDVAWNNSDTIEFTYKVNGVDLQDPVDLIVYLADDEGNYLGEIYSITAETAAGTHGPITVPRTSLEQIPYSGATRIMVGADLYEILSETNEDNNQKSVAIPTLSIGTLNWRNDLNGADLSWNVGGHPLPQSSEVRVFWSTDGTAEGIDGDAIYQQTLPAGASSGGQVHLTAAMIGVPPLGATILVAVIDPIDLDPFYGRIIESDEDDNLKSLKPDISINTFEWTADGLGVEATYTVRGAVPTDTTFLWYWATGETFFDRIGEPVYSSTISSTPGDYGPESMTFAALGLPPVGATHLIAVADLSEDEQWGIVDENSEDNNVAFIALPDLSISEADWNATTGDLKFRYLISENDLPRPTQISVYWASGSTFDDRIDEAIIFFTTPTARGVSSELTVLADMLTNPPVGADRLIIVADPLDGQSAPGLIVEVNEDNNVLAILPDLRLRTPTWTTSGGAVTGIEFQYFIGGFLPQAASYSAWWATGTNFDSRLGGPLQLGLTETTGGLSPTYTVSAGQIASRPVGANYLLVAGDLPDDLVLEESEANNIATLSLPDLQSTGGEWIVDKTGPTPILSLEYTYNIAFGNAPVAAPVQFFWATGTTQATIIGGAIASQTLATTAGSHTFTFVAGTPPETAQYLLAVLDSGETGIVPERNETNNIFAVANNRAPKLVIEPEPIPPVVQKPEESIAVPVSTVAIDTVITDDDAVLVPDLESPDVGVVVEDVNTVIPGIGTVLVEVGTPPPSSSALPGMMSMSSNDIVWEPLGDVSPTNARLLSPNMFIRFIVPAGFTGRLSDVITFRAWDQSTGTAGGYADTTSNGGSSAFSSATLGMDVVVVPESLNITNVDFYTPVDVQREYGYVRIETDRDGEGIPLLYELDVDNDGTFEISSPYNSLYFGLDTIGQHTIGIRVTNTFGDVLDSTTIQIEAVNWAPELEFTGLITGAVGQDVLFEGWLWDADAELTTGITLFIDWNGDNTPDETVVIHDREFSLTHQFATPGVYQVNVIAQDPYGAFSDPVSHTLEVFIPGAAPAGAFVAVTPDPTEDPVDSVTLVFQQPVVHLALYNFELTRNGNPISLAGATLTTNDDQTFVLSGLASLTTQSGNYQIKLLADQAADFFAQTNAADITESWVMNGGVDETAPTLSITPNGTTTGAGATLFTFQFSETVTGFVVGDISLTNGTAGAFTAVDGDTYTLLVTPNGNGLVTVSVAAGAAQDEAENQSLAASASITSDQVAPTLTITPTGTTTGAGATLFTFQFSKTVTGFAVGDISLTNGSAGTFTAVDGDTYTLLVTPNGNGLVTVNVAAAAAQDSVGNNSVAASASITSDQQAPSLVITPNGITTGASSILFTFQFSETVTGFDVTDISLTNGTAGAFTAVDGDTYTLAVTPDGDGLVSVSVAASAAQDGVGNNSLVASASVTSDSSVPTVSITAVSPDPRTTAVTSITIVFSEPVTGFDLSDLSLTRDSGGNLLTGSQTLTTSDNITFVLGNLSGLTGAAGTYVLELDAQGSGIENANELVLEEDATETWSRVLPTVLLSIDEANIAEANGTAIVTATLSQATDVDVVVTLGFGGSAAFPDDYSRTGSQITIPAGQTTGTITLTAVSDGRLESAESITVDIASVSQGLEDGSQQVTTQITDDDHAPVFTSSATPSVVEETTAVVTLTATDADLPAQTLTFSITGGADQARFTLSNTGVLSFINAPDFEIPGDANSDNVYELEVTVNDGQGGVTTQQMQVTVTDGEENPAPVVDVVGGAVTWVKKQAPAVVVPELTVGSDSNLVGGTLTISVNAAGSKKKTVDQYSYGSTTALGTTSGFVYANGRLTLTIQLGAGATSSAIENFLRSITFTTKGKGLKQATRAFEITLREVGGLQSTDTQTINVIKKLPKV